MKIKGKSILHALDKVNWNMEYWVGVTGCQISALSRNTFLMFFLTKEKQAALGGSEHLYL